jgi:hypothetical protein
MTYRINPLTEEQLNEIAPNGTYNFKVIKSERTSSKAGNPMAALTLEIWQGNGKKYPIFTYLVFSDVNMNIRTVKHFCESTDLEDEYKKGELREDLRGLIGKVDIASEKGALIPPEKLNGKPLGSRYRDKNVVLDYLAKDAESKTFMPDFPECANASEKLPLKEMPGDLNDDIPF